MTNSTYYVAHDRQFTRELKRLNSEKEGNAYKLVDCCFDSKWCALDAAQKIADRTGQKQHVYERILTVEPAG